MDGRMRVCVRNTFITFDEGEEQPEERASPRASPRARSAECSSPRREEGSEDQIRRLNKILDDDEDAVREARSPVLQPGPLPDFDGPGRVRAESFASSGASSPPEVLPGKSGPSAQELNQLKQRLEEVCRVPNGYPMQRASSSGSVWSMGSEATEDHRGLRHVHSNGSISSMTSFEANRSRACSFGSIYSGMEDEPIEPVEFDLVEYPDDAPKPEREREHRREEPYERREDRRRHSRPKPREPGPQEAACPQPKPVGLVDESPTTSCSPRPGSAASRCSSPSEREKSKAWQKEYRHSLVPKTVNLQDEYQQNQGQQDVTTLMIRNIPNRYSQRDLIAELEDLGFAGKFNFLYIPLDKGTMANVGYAFVNFIDKDWAKKCMEAFYDYRFKRHRKTSGKIASVSAAHLQGLEANLAHYERAVVNTAKLKQRRPVVIANISSSLE